VVESSFDYTATIQILGYLYPEEVALYLEFNIIENNAA
jgi:hypothetical protein